jgi:DNA-binding MarR family transcriptional regulator
MSDPSTPPQDIAEVAHRLRLATARLARLLRQQAGTGLSPSQFSVLTSIDVNRSVTLGELAAIEQVAPPTITKIVSKLEEDGLVVRSIDSRDRRVARVSISEGGRARLDHSRSRRDAWLSRRLEEVGPADVARVAGALDVLEALAAGAFQPPPRDADQAARDEHAADADDTESSEQARAKEPSHSTVNP